MCDTGCVMCYMIYGRCQMLVLCVIWCVLYVMCDVVCVIWYMVYDIWFLLNGRALMLHDTCAKCYMPYSECDVLCVVGCML